jgi:hypothetical protein
LNLPAVSFKTLDIQKWRRALEGNPRRLSNVLWPAVENLIRAV